MTTAKGAKASRSAESDEPGLGIGALAKAAGVSERTVRYYEELGIIPSPRRSAGGTRRYPKEYRFYIEGALVLKDLGFSLEELKLVGRLVMGSNMTARQRERALDVVDRRMDALDRRIRVLNRLRELFTSELNDSGQPDDRLAALLDHATNGTSA